MKLVHPYLDPSEAAEARQKLREAGIASVVDAMNPHSVQPSRSGATHVGLWVLVDEQLEDAVEVLENPHHVPGHVLDPAEIERLEASADRAKLSRRRLDKAMLLALFAGLMALIVFTAVDFVLNR